MNILGVSAGFHDAGIALISNGEIVFAGHSERYSKHKHDSKLNEQLIADALVNSTVYPDTIAYYERPWLKKTRQLYAGQYQDFFTGPSPRQMIKQVSMGTDLYKLPIKTFGHHQSHAAAGFQTSPFGRACVVVIDAIGEWDTISIWHAWYERGEAKYQRMWHQSYPHSIGLLYSAFTKAVGLKPLDEEYILMGMSGWGDEISSLGLKYNHLKNWLIEHESNLTFKHNFHIGLPSDNLIKEFKSNENIARAAQELTEELINIVIHKAKQLVPTDNLVYMGGVALNCLANRHLGNYFENVWIMPNPGDCGSSLGAAALAYKRQLNWQSPYLGYNICGEYPVNGLINELITNKIVGVASGRAEFGPRALGNRSLLADPRGAEIKDRVNTIKRRQKFRPFAPVILEEYAEEYFEMPKGFKTSPYMQTVVKCKYPEQFPAIVHVDGTSRVQTVGKNCTSGIRQLLERWVVWTGCPMLLNTSLNIRGEPMVNTREDADRFEKLYGVRVLS